MSAYHAGSRRRRLRSSICAATSRARVPVLRFLEIMGGNGPHLLWKLYMVHALELDLAPDRKLT